MLRPMGGVYFVYVVFLYPSGQFSVESVRQLLQFGDHIRVLRSVTRFHERAAQFIEAYQADGSADFPSRSGP